MNINNVIRALRQSLKLQQISVYCVETQPSLPANRALFDIIAPMLKLLLKAFKQTDFSACISRWGEMTFFSQTLGVEVLIRIEPNANYMSRVSKAALKSNGYEVLEVQMPRKPFVLNYFFYGTKSKWRQISFDLDFASVESVYFTLIQPILQSSKPFQGRLKSSRLIEKNKSFVTPDNVYAFARYAAHYLTNVYGLATFCETSESKYVRECYFSDYGALMLTDYWHGIQMIQWHKNDKAFLKKHIPEIFEPYQIASPSIATVPVDGDEHQFMLGSLDKAFIKKYNGIDEVEDWLNEPQYFTDKIAPKLMLDSAKIVSKVLTALIR